MKPESLLDSVVFQLDESRSRCELWISAGESAERLASGYLTPFLSHLQTAQEQLANHCDCITLQCPSSSSQVASWFTKRTIERFVRFVSTPDVLERVSFLEAERVKLAEASSILISTESPHVSSPALLESANPGKQQKADRPNAQQAHAQEEHSMDTLEMETESSRRHLVKAMDARRLILDKEQMNAFSRAAAAGFSADSLPDLMAFADYFGATRLREACSKFADLHRKLLLNSAAVATAEKLDTDSGSGLASGSGSGSGSGFGTQSSSRSTEERVGVEEVVRNFGRRRVWGPPVSEIPLQLPSERVPDERDANGALTPEDDPESDSPRKSTASCARESDWEGNNEGNSANPVYENVLTSKDECSGLEAREEMSSASVETSAIRRKGIVVIKKNLKFPQAGPNSGKQSDSESDRDSSENENRVAGDGRLSVQAAISLFETKQKKSKPSSSDVEKKVPDRSRTGGKQDSAAATSQAHAQVLKSPTREFQSGKQKLAAENANSQSGLPRCDRNIKANSSLESMKIDARSTQRIKNGQNEQVEQRMQPRLAKEGVRTTNSTAKTAEEIRKDLLSRTQQRTNAGNQATVKSADEISKELLDRSYNCLLKINSVVQDALFSASTLRQTKKLEEAKTDTEAADAESREWRSLANVSKLSLDDIFVEKRVSAKESSRRQSLCSPEEYGAGAVHGQIDQIPAPVASSDTQKGRFYEQYQEIRAAKYRKEPTHTKAERESKLRAMHDVLERRKTELLGRTTRLPEKNNTMTIEQLRAMKLQAMKNTVRKEPRSDSIKSLQSERLGARTRSSNILRSKQESSPCSTNSSSSTRKISPGLPKPAATPRNLARLSTSPGSKFSSPGAPGSHRRANFMSQSVISESLHTQADLRKENARPLTGRNSLTGQPSRNYSRSDKVNRNLVLEASSPTSLRDNNSEKKRVGKDRTHQVLAPLRVPRDRSDDEKSRVKYDLPKNQGGSRIVTPRPKFAAAATKIEAPESKSEAGTTVSVVSSTPVSTTKSSDECIKQIVSCTSKDRNDHALESSNVLPPVEATEVPVIIKKSEMVTEMVSEMVSEVFKEEQKPDEHLYTPSKHAFVSSFDDDDMQIDEALEKCMSGRSFLDGISASPLTSFEPTTIAAAAATSAKTKEQLWNEQEHKIMSASLRSGPSSQSLPHLQRSISPTTVASFRNDFAAKEIKPLCKEHHQNKDQPKGLKRLLKFGRRSRGSDSNVADWNTINDDLVVQGSGSGKIRNEEIQIQHPRSAGSSGVRRSLEALPKIADAASELSARNFFSSFRIKSSASDSARSRA